jgi:hypothetical protein
MGVIRPMDSSELPGRWSPSLFLGLQIVEFIKQEFHLKQAYPDVFRILKIQSI